MVKSFLVVACIIVMSADGARGQSIYIQRVIDGDTFELSNGRIVELIGVNAPGIEDEKCPVAENIRGDEEMRALGALATEHAMTWFQGKEIKPEWEGGYPNFAVVDTLSAYLFIVERGRRVFMINELMIADGFAQACLGQHYRYRAKFLMSQKNARDRHLGLWDPDRDHIFPTAGTKRGVNCHAFTSHEESVAFFEDEGGPEFDPYLLDTDRDGIPCERLLD